MPSRQRTYLYLTNQDHLQLVETIKKNWDENGKWNSKLLQANVAALDDWQSGDVGSKVSRQKNKTLVSSVRYKWQLETCLRCLHTDLCVNCSQRACVGDMKLNEEPITISKFLFIH